MRSTRLMAPPDQCCRPSDAECRASGGSAQVGVVRMGGRGVRGAWGGPSSATDPGGSVTASTRPLALVTGASSGIGLELARQFAEHGYDLVIAAEDAELDAAERSLAATGATVVSVRTDLATSDGVDELFQRVQSLGRPIDSVAINAGVGVSGKFTDAALQDHLDLVQLNVTGAVHLAHLVLRQMVANHHGRVLFTSSIAAKMPGPYQSTYNASKSFLLSLSEALRTEY